MNAAKKPKKDALYVVDGLRTPFGKSGGALSSLEADDLGRLCVRHLLARHVALAESLEEFLFGCVGQSARAANVARVIALRSGIPPEVPAMTVHRNCASGMEAIAEVMKRRDEGGNGLFLVGGTESMSSYPLNFSAGMTKVFSSFVRAKSLGKKLAALSQFRPSYMAPRIALIEGLTDPVCGESMGKTAENIARDFGISRSDQDAYALASHQKAAAAQARLREESVLIVGESGILARDDESVRPQQSLEALARLKPVFTRSCGTVTPGNACPVSDGAVALILARGPALAATQQKPLGRVVDQVVVGLDPTRMGLGPVHAIARLLAKNALSLEDVNLFEINEAFAAQVLGCLAALESPSFAKKSLGMDEAPGRIPLAKLNVNGGAIALGHPVGASGARLVLTLLKELERRGQKRGIAALCVGGGQGAALLVERD